MASLSYAISGTANNNRSLIVCFNRIVRVSRCDSLEQVVIGFSYQQVSPSEGEETTLPVEILVEFEKKICEMCSGGEEKCSDRIENTEFCSE